MNITEKSSKDDIITGSIEVIDSQASEIDSLKGDRTALIFIASVVFIWGVLF